VKAATAPAYRDVSLVYHTILYDLTTQHQQMRMTQFAYDKNIRVRVPRHFRQCYQKAASTQLVIILILRLQARADLQGPLQMQTSPMTFCTSSRAYILHCDIGIRSVIMFVLSDFLSVSHVATKQVKLAALPRTASTTSFNTTIDTQHKRHSSSGGR
jgi:hypothetical protein